MDNKTISSQKIRLNRLYNVKTIPKEGIISLGKLFENNFIIKIK